MTTPLSIRTTRGFVVWFVVLQLGSLIDLRASPTTEKDALAASGAWLKAFGASKALILSGDVVKGEKTLLDANQSKSGTPAWHMESATALMEMGFALRHLGKVDASVAVGRDALSQLAEAEQYYKLPADANALARVKELAGTINERIAGTSEQARTYYKSAVQLNPNSNKSAAALKRMEDGDEAAAQRQKTKGGS